MKTASKIKDENILIIKLGALGDMIQSLGPMAAIRRHHPNARISVLTTAPYAPLLEAAPYIDDVLATGRPRTLAGWISLIGMLRRQGFRRVYDLQNSDRSAALCFMLHGSFHDWVGAMPGATIRNRNPRRSDGLSIDGHRETLALAGITQVPIDILDWVHTDHVIAGLQPPYALIVPGSAPSRPEKRWPAACYGHLAAGMWDDGVQPVVIGTPDDADPAHTITHMVPKALSLIGQTALTDLPDLARGAVYAVGNDTGPMHVVAATGCPTIALYKRSASNARKHGLSGAHVTTLECAAWAEITPDRVMRCLREYGRPDHRPAAHSTKSC